MNEETAGMKAESQISFVMKQFDLFDKPMNGLYSRTSRGGICRVSEMGVPDSVLFGIVDCSGRFCVCCSTLSFHRNRVCDSADRFDSFSHIAEYRH